MHELPNNSIHLVVTSPPYYNAPFDYPDLFKDYDEFLQLIRRVAKELHRVLAHGRITCFVTDDMLVNGEKYPVVADITKIMIQSGFRYRDKITWVKPKGYTRISRRSGVVIQHPYPMYFYPDNMQESILIFQKGKFNYDYLESLPKKARDASKINLGEYNGSEWNLSVWKITNVLPKEGRLEEGIAAFPEELAARLIKLFSFAGETVLDPFLGSGTTSKVAMQHGRNSVGYEIDLDLKATVMEKVANGKSKRRVEVIERSDTRNLRKFLLEKVKKQKSVTRF